jgi:HAD superfamily hydrolase (TIGR01549 family)
MQRKSVMAKVVIFDVDGTLVDSNEFHAEAWRQALAHFGYNVPLDEIRPQIGKGGDQLLPALIPKREAEVRGKEIDKYRSSLFKKKYRDQVTAFPAVHDLFELLRSKGHIVMLASSGNKSDIDHAAKTARISDLIDIVVTGDDVEHSKPRPDIFSEAMKRVAPITDAIVVGDSPWDAKAADKVGLRTIGVLCGGFSEATLKDAGCVAVYSDPASLLQNYDASPLGAKLRTV